RGLDRDRGSRGKTVRAFASRALVMLAFAPVARAQDRPTMALRGDAAAVWLSQETAPGVVNRWRGPALAGEARVNYGPFAIGASLLEGRLDALGGAASRRDLVEGRVLVAARALPWLEVSLGPLVRAYVTDSTTERWVVWQGRARIDAPILTNRLASYIEGWRAFSSQVTLPPLSAGRVQGGEAGMVYRPPRGGSLWLRLAYRVDNALLGAGSETAEAVTFSVGIGR
ncbi:MAG: hypothetical protein DMD67_09115, partial [Gemmatimonadetes bacterium]